MDTARSQGWAADERWHLRRDGSRFYMSGVMRPIFNPDLRGYVKVARDMTEQQEAAEALRVTEERYRIALSSAEMGAWDWDLVSDEIAWNEQHFELLGLPPGNHPKKPADLIESIYPDDRAQFLESLNAAVTACGIFNTDFRIRRSDNEVVRWMHGYGKVIERDGDRALRMVGVMHDITENKALEREKDQFIAVASHELRTPVTAIKAYSEVLRDSLEESADAMNTGLIRKLDGQVDRLMELIRALLDVTRIREGKLHLKPERFELGALLLEVLEEMGALSETGIQLEITQVANVIAERERIRQVVTNLLSNALHYSPQGSPVHVSLSVEGGEATVAIRDFGTGIAAELQDQIFERYFRAESEPGGRYSGLGLGLYIAAEIIERHGGRIWTEKPAGQGARFAFTLALAGNRTGYEAH